MARLSTTSHPATSRHIPQLRKVHTSEIDKLGLK